MQAGKIKINKATICGIIAVVLLAAPITAALLGRDTKTLTNEFYPGEVTTEIEESPEIEEATIKKDPSVRNLGPNDCIVRMRVLISPGQVGDFLTETGGIAYADSWKYRKEDGFWYYQKVVSVNESTQPLFTEIKGMLTADGKIKEQFEELEQFEVTLYQEAVQSVMYDKHGSAYEAFDENGNYDNTHAMEIWNRYEKK